MRVLPLHCTNQAQVGLIMLRAQDFRRCCRVREFQGLHVRNLLLLHSYIHVAGDHAKREGHEAAETGLVVLMTISAVAKLIVLKSHPSPLPTSICSGVPMYHVALPTSTHDIW